jgi:murein DD-endopeptidase MepM/ murein hydrolase activator NlpD
VGIASFTARLLSAAAVAVAATLALALPAAAEQDAAASDAEGGATDTTTATTPDQPPPDVPPPTGTEPQDPEPTGDDEDLEAARRGKLSLGDRRLHQGMHGRDVRRLQEKLRELNLPLRVDGKFGPKTKRRVKLFERWRNMVPNGEVGRDQANRMKKLVRQGVTYRKHRFPVRGPHDYGGSGSRFGAPRSGHTHMGQDIAAAEGTRLVSVAQGRVHFRGYQASGAGHYLVIRGKGGADAVYMHLRGPAKVARGERVAAGQEIGRVGCTGSCFGAHLHFELWTPHWFDGGHAYDPLRKLRKWDRHS